MKIIRVRIPASIANLGPGFDCLGVAVGLYNRVAIAPGIPDGDPVEITGEGIEDLPRSGENLILRSAKALFDHLGREFPGLRVQCENRIPLWRGLGSSAAAVVGGLVAANAWLGNPADLGELLDLAARIEGHPDNVAAALFGGLTVSAATPRGALALRVHLPVLERLRFVLAVPDQILPTEEARAVLPKEVPFADATFNLSRTALLLAALVGERLDRLADAVEDRLHQPFRKLAIRGCDAVFESARGAGARAVFISGAGPTIAALAETGAEEIGQAMVSAFGEHGVGARSLVVGVDTEGTVVERASEE